MALTHSLLFHPAGRNMNQCMRAWEDMIASQTPAPPPQFPTEKRRARDDLNDRLPKPSALWSASPGPTLQPMNSLPPGPGPPAPNGYVASPTSSSPPATVPRKRGRPSRARHGGSDPRTSVPYVRLRAHRTSSRADDRAAREAEEERAPLRCRQGAAAGESTSPGAGPTFRGLTSRVAADSAPGSSSRQVRRPSDGSPARPSSFATATTQHASESPEPKLETKGPDRKETSTPSEASA